MEPPAVEREVGMEVYLTSSPGVGGRLRTEAEDFLVEELSLPPPLVEGGPYTAARVRSRNWEMNRLVRELSRDMGISRKRVQFAGTKDKRGVKVQLLTFRASPEQVRGIRLRDFEVLELHPTDKPIELGQLLGNRFEIRLRGASPPPGRPGGGKSAPGDDPRALEQACGAVWSELLEAGGMPNFFGIQRFGALRPVTHVIGERMVRGDFEGAVMAYLGRPHPDEPEDAREARGRLERERDFGAAVGYFPRNLGFERTLIHHLQLHPGDWTGAIRKLPLNLLMMFVHAYQSCLFNRVLSQRIKASLPLDEPRRGDIVLPADDHGRPDHDRHILVEDHDLSRIAGKVRQRKAFVSGCLFGSATSPAGGEMGDMERSVIEAEGLRPEDFVLPELPEASSKGTRRELLVPMGPGDLSVSFEPGSVLFSFSLPRGSYATALMREFMKGQVLDY